MLAVDWDDAFDNSGYIEGAENYFSRWAEKAESARAQMIGETEIAYGAHEREKLDLFLPKEPPLGLIIFVHGGYWHRLDKDHFSHLALGSLARGWAVAMIGYPLAPEFRVSQITQSVAKGVRHAASLADGPIRLIGHSAGGHLVSRLLCEASLLGADNLERVEKTISVSGVHDLRPLMQTKMNEILQLTEDECLNESPALLAGLKDANLHFWVGAEERPEFLRQTRLIAEAWSNLGNRVTSTYEADTHHFSVVDGLEFSDSAITSTLLS